MLAMLPCKSNTGAKNKTTRPKQYYLTTAQVHLALRAMPGLWCARRPLHSMAYLSQASAMNSIQFQTSRCSRCPFKESLLWISEYSEHSRLQYAHTAHYFITYFSTKPPRSTLLKRFSFFFKKRKKEKNFFSLSHSDSLHRFIINRFLNFSFKSLIAPTLIYKSSL
jgi:hypothetical protein